MHGRLQTFPIRGGDLGLTWRAGFVPVSTVQQSATDLLSLLLLGSSLSVLAIAAITVLVLALARESERAAELVVRRAVGASRRVLFGAALVEGTAIVAAGLAIGVLAALVVSAAMAEWPGPLGSGTTTLRWIAAGVLACAVLLGVAFPVLLPRRRLADTEPRSPSPLTPSAIQIGGSLVVLTMGALLARHADVAMADRVLGPRDAVVRPLTMRDTAPALRAQRYAAFLDQLADSGTRASLTSPGGLLGLGTIGTVTTDCGQCSEGGLPIRWRVKAATHQFVTADTFHMLGIRVVEGRGLTRRDAWGTQRVAVINRSLAAREFQFGEAIGRGIRVVDDGEEWSTVVGVVDDPPAVGLGAGTQPRYSVYLSVLQHPPESLDLMTPGNREREVQVAASVLGPRVIDGPARPVRALVDREVAPLRWFAAQFGLQGWAMLAIAALGALAAARLWVTSLLAELGVRRAVGARRRHTIGFVLVRAAAVCLAGLAGGVWFGQAIWGILSDLVPGLVPWNAGVVLRFGLVLLAAVLAGSLPPAWRASRTAPATLLSAP